MASAVRPSRVGFLAVGRPTFDLALGAAKAAAAADVMRSAGLEVLGATEPVVELDDIASSASAWSEAEIDALVVFQATFSDSSLTVAAAGATDVPVLLWSAPEPRRGERLRHNSFCGVNLAAYTLKRSGRAYRWVHHEPTAPGVVDAVLAGLAGGAGREPAERAVSPGPAARAAATELVAKMAQWRVGVIGEHPTGFEPCAYDPEAAERSFGTSIESVPIEALFDSARRAAAVDVRAARDELGQRFDLAPVAEYDIEPSTRLLCGLRQLASEHDWSALATRCWPECFTEFGGAACGPQALLSTDGTPAVCEADAYGALTSLMLQELAGEPAFVADIVAVDEETIVVWHCGLAPHTMAGDRPPATTHFARGLPVLGEFALAPGPVTISRVSQSDNRTRLVIGRGELIDAPLPFAGTAGTIRTESPPARVLDTIMGEGLEHHFGIVYGDVTEELGATAELLGIDVVSL